MKTRFRSSRRERSASACGGGQPPLHRHLPDPLLVQAGPVVLDHDLHVVAALGGLEPHPPDLRLAGPPAHLRRLDAVVDGVADEVHERIRQLLHDELVQLHVPAHDHEVDLLAHLAGQLAHHARQLVEDLVEGDHPHLEDPGLQLGQLAFQRPAEELQLAALGGVRPLRLQALGVGGERGPDEHQLPHHVHEPVELVDVHPHRLRGGAERRRLGRPGLRQGRQGRRGGRGLDRGRWHLLRRGAGRRCRLGCSPSAAAPAPLRPPGPASRRMAATGSREA